VITIVAMTVVTIPRNNPPIIIIITKNPPKQQQEQHPKKKKQPKNHPHYYPTKHPQHAASVSKYPPKKNYPQLTDVITPIASRVLKHGQIVRIPVPCVKHDLPRLKR
jgi:hypothetical protein